MFEKLSAFCSSNEFSHLAMTIVAVQFPITLTVVRAISIKTSMPSIKNTGVVGSPKLDRVPSNTTSAARETPAVPLLVSINTKHIASCSAIERLMPATWATKTQAIDKYNAVPSRLKLYPVGITNATISLGTPNRSIYSSAAGNADSELAVANAIDAGSLNARIYFLIWIFKKRIKDGCRQ